MHSLGRRSDHKPGRREARRGRFRGAVRLASAGLTAAAVARELRRPHAERTWHGRVANVPYDFRRPTLARVRQTFWAPDNPHLLVPHAFGVGWSINLGRLARVAREVAQAGHRDSGSR